MYELVMSKGGVYYVIDDSDDNMRIAHKITSYREKHTKYRQTRIIWRLDHHLLPKGTPKSIRLKSDYKTLRQLLTSNPDMLAKFSNNPGPNSVIKQARKALLSR